MDGFERADRLTVEANDLAFECLVWGDHAAREPLLCLHGFPDDPGSFGPLAAELDRPVVAPYARGYGPTGPAPDGRYDPLALAADAVALADTLDTREVFGHDWGAVAAYTAIAGHDRFDRVATAAVPPNFTALLLEHPRQLLRSWYVWAFQLPGTERALRARDFSLLELLWRTWSPGWDYPRERVARVKATFREDDTVANALAYYRQMVRGVATSVFRNGMPTRRTFATPVLVMTGADDGCIDTALFDDIGTDFDSARVVRVPDAGHFCHWERAGVVADELATWFG